jgi:hypothetical protein
MQSSAVLPEKGLLQLNLTDFPEPQPEEINFADPNAVIDRSALIRIH